MTFLAAEHLLALAVIPILLAIAVAERRRRRRYAVRFPGVAVVRGITGAAPAWRRWFAPALLALAAAALAISWARPETTVAVPVEKASVVLVTDGSGSMAATDVSPSRLEAARSAAFRFLDRVPDSLLVGFVGYAEAPGIVEEPTADHDRIRAALSSLNAVGGTATGDALTAALDRLESRRGKDGEVAPAAIVLLSDGKTTAGTDPLDAAARAKRLKIPVFTVALGTENGIIPGGPFRPDTPVPPDPETLRQIAATSGGRAYEVDDAGQLDRVYETLGSRIGTRKERREISSGFAGAGLLLLGAGLLAGLRRRPTL